MHNIYERRVCDWNEYMGAILELTYKNRAKLWYRGHGDCNWNLLPTVKRPPFNITNNEIKNKERILATDFYIEACQRMKNHPTDKAGWISLMQHYGLPTRLLDWSESPLIALYFAVSEDTNSDKDSVIWALNPVLLNSSQGLDACLFPMNYDTVTDFIEPAFRHRKEPNKIIACCSVENDLRMYVQQAAFTVHSTNTPLEQLEGAEKFLHKIIIPKEIKKSFAYQLNLCGFRLSNIFPDIEHISRELKDAFS